MILQEILAMKTGNILKNQREFKSFRLTLLSIGAYEPKWFMQYAHMNP